MKERLVCVACVREEFLSKQIEDLGALDVCFYCASTAMTYSIEQLADLVSRALSEHFERSYPTDVMPSSYRIDGVVDVISYAADVAGPIAEDIRKTLADRDAATGIEIESAD